MRSRLVDQWDFVAKRAIQSSFHRLVTRRPFFLLFSPPLPPTRVERRKGSSIPLGTANWIEPRRIGLLVTKASTPPTHSNDSPKPQRFPRGAAPRLAAATWLEFERIRARLYLFVKSIVASPHPLLPRGVDRSDRSWSQPTFIRSDLSRHPFARDSMISPLIASRSYHFSKLAPRWDIAYVSRISGPFSSFQSRRQVCAPDALENRKRMLVRGRELSFPFFFFLFFF